MTDRMNVMLVLENAQSNILAQPTLKAKACFRCGITFKGLLKQLPVRWKQ